MPPACLTEWARIAPSASATAISPKRMDATLLHRMGTSAAESQNAGDLRHYRNRDLDRGFGDRDQRLGDMNGANDHDSEARIVDMDEAFAFRELVHAAFAGAESTIEHLSQRIVCGVLA